MGRRYLIGAFLILMFAPGFSFAQKEKFQSLFIYNFSRYIKWPDDMMSGDFVIGVMGQSGIYKELQTMAEAKKQTQGMNIIVKQFNSVSEIQKCHILFVSDNLASQLGAISGAAQVQSTLIVTDSPGSAKKGAAINFVEESSRIKFELNQSEADKRNLKISGSLISLAILV